MKYYKIFNTNKPWDYTIVCFYNEANAIYVVEFFKTLPDISIQELLEEQYNFMRNASVGPQ